MSSLLWTIHGNAYWTTVKLAAFASVSPVYPQCGQHTETRVHVLIDHQSARLFWVNVLRSVLGQVVAHPGWTGVLEYGTFGRMKSGKAWIQRPGLGIEQVEPRTKLSKLAA
jgi:hypothetical protein